MSIDPLAVVSDHGLGAHSVEVLVERPGRLVARVETRSGSVVVKADERAGAFEAEVEAIGRLASAGLPVPEVVASEHGPPSYAMLSWIEGTPLSSSSPIEAQREAGRLLSRVHALGGGPPYAGNVTWMDWMQGWMDHAMGWWKERYDTDADRIDRAWAWFEDLRPRLATRGHELLLFDGRPEHFRIVDGRVSGLIDLAEIRSGDAAMDLGVMAVFDPALLPGVLAGYAPSALASEAFDELVPFYTFLRRLAAVEWNLNFGDHRLAERVLKRIDQAAPARGGR